MNEIRSHLAMRMAYHIEISLVDVETANFYILAPSLIHFNRKLTRSDCMVVRGIDDIHPKVTITFFAFLGRKARFEIRTVLECRKFPDQYYNAWLDVLVMEPSMQEIPKVLHPSF